MTAARVFQFTLALVLWYLLTGLVFTRALAIWPPGFEAEGYFLAGAALPWSLLTLGFYAPTDSVAGAAVRDLLFFGLIAVGIAVNAVLINGLLGALWRRLRVALRLHRIRRASAARIATRRAARGKRPKRPLRRP